MLTPNRFVAELEKGAKFLTWKRSSKKALEKVRLLACDNTGNYAKQWEKVSKEKSYSMFMTF
tara:strand:+ start:120 stop:305 length:186 start_codon:yes stop_codon:yes gene_type:complete